MRNAARSIVCFISVFLAAHSAAQVHQVPANALMDAFAQKEEVTILITDSGLGGVAVCADIEERLHRDHPFRSVKLVFCNALPESDYGYNMMGSAEEKIRTFSLALSGMTKWYSPDIILIACNTLSVLYEQTDYSRTAAVPVVSIVDIGVRMMADALNKEPASSVIIFGTETTIEANSHKALLMKNGIAGDRIVTQSCPDLAGEIQSDAGSDAVESMIEFDAGDAVEKLGTHGGTVYAGLCCTHFGYAAEKFFGAVSRLSKRTTVVIDPTRSMGGVVFHQGSSNRFAATALSVHAASRAVITPQEALSIAALIEGRSEPTANALRKYEMKKDLFEFERVR
jgi:glutamate racemase